MSGTFYHCHYHVCINHIYKINLNWQKLKYVIKYHNDMFLRVNLMFSKITIKLLKFQLFLFN